MESIVAKLDAALYPAVCSVNTYLSNYILVFLLVAVGLWYSIKTRFIQVRCFGEGMRRVFGNLTLNGKKHDSGMSSFQALATAIAAQVGTGNIVGVATAIVSGGPGAIFWMWVMALLGMMTSFSENVLGVYYRRKNEKGEWSGGAMYYLTDGLGAKKGCKQLGKVLFEDLRLPHGKKTKTGWSTNADVLEKLRYEAPIVGAVLEYRQYAKLKSTYADGLLKAMDPDGRIRTRFQMTVTATGRLSSTEPNLQNIPTRTELGSQMRRMFVAAPGNLLVDADYSQIELRLLAHISGDEVMQQAFRSGEDFHTLTASKVFHVPPEEVTHQMRSRAKAVNFGIVYGISPFSLSQDIGVTVAEAKEYMERYFATYTGVRRYMTEVVEQARQQGYVATLFGRRRALPELKSSNFNLRSFGERVALNMPIQGTAADIMKLAMVAVEKRLKKELPEAKLVLQVHDELIVECPKPQAEAAAKLLEEEMEQVAHLSVPLTAEAHWGRNWLEAKG